MLNIILIVGEQNVFFGYFQTFLFLLLLFLGVHLLGFVAGCEVPLEVEQGSLLVPSEFIDVVISR